MRLDQWFTVIRRQSSSWPQWMWREDCNLCEIGKNENVLYDRFRCSRIADSDERNLSDDFTYQRPHCPLTRNADLIEKGFHAWKRDWDNDDCYTIVRGITAMSREMDSRKKKRDSIVIVPAVGATSYWLSAPCFGPRDSYRGIKMPTIDIRSVN